ncbi:MAG: response regulator [Paracoccaceae bacterium]
MTDLVRILHVEDDPDISSVVHMSLTMLGGYEVAQFGSGREAVENAEGQDADLLLLDMMMPGLNGLETLARLRQYPQFADTPALLFTAKTVDLPPDEEARARGIIGTIRKPFGATDLPDEIRNKWNSFANSQTAPQQMTG